ncbi:MAG: PTS sugar transporter subunit IIA [Candidatus Latescibacteria bacterium]|nr:PTS sugar transporter subunit IIA [Candidatus Latescibacterota bacterium]
MDAKFAFQAEIPEGLQPLLDPALMVPELKADNKIAAIKELIDRLYLKGVVKDSLSFFQAVLGRENIESTILGEVAMPHARSLAVNQLGLALGVSRLPIDYPSGDERQAVQIICLIAVPAHAPDSYLALLGALARTFRDADLIDSLLQAASPEELCDLLATHSRHLYREG